MRQHFAYCAPLNLLARSPSYRRSDLVASPDGALAELPSPWPRSGRVLALALCLYFVGCCYSSYTVWYMQTETAVRFRITPNMRRLLDRLRNEEDINVSAWVRRHIENALRERFPEEFQDHEDRTEETAGETPQPQQPITGWKPRKVGEEEPGKVLWGAALQGPDVARLPDELRGIRIVVTPASTGVPWTTAITEVVSRSEDEVVVRHAGRPGNDR